MARKSTLGRRVACLLDVAQSRGTIRGKWRSFCALFALALGRDPCSIQAQESASRTGTAAGVSNWSRTYRDTYRLQKIFAEQHQGSAEEAMATLRKEFAANGINIPEGVKLELTPDKGALTLEYDDRQLPDKPLDLANFFIRSGWWDEANTSSARQRALQWNMAPVNRELEKQRKLTEECAVEMARIRSVTALLTPIRRVRTQ
jgi:hypothetical protein